MHVISTILFVSTTFFSFTCPVHALLLRVRLREAIRTWEVSTNGATSARFVQVVIVFGVGREELILPCTDFHGFDIVFGLL